MSGLTRYDFQSNLAVFLRASPVGNVPTQLSTSTVELSEFRFLSSGNESQTYALRTYDFSSNQHKTEHEGNSKF